MPTKEEVEEENAKLRSQIMVLERRSGVLAKQPRAVPFPKPKNELTKIEILWYNLKNLYKTLETKAKGLPKYEQEYRRLIAEKETEFVAAYNQARLEKPEIEKVYGPFVKGIEKPVAERVAEHRKLIKERYNIDLP